jgi:Tfp pilus assembly protein PilO
MKFLLQPLIVSSAIIIIVIVGFTFIFNWQISDLDAQTVQIASQKADLQKKIALLSSLGDLKSQSGAVAQYQQEMDAMLPSSDQLLDFPNWLDGLSRINSVSMNFTFQGNQTPPTQSAPGYIIFNISLGGKLQDIINFMNAMEISLPRYMINFQTINLNQVGSSTQVTINGQLFFR